MTFPITEQAEIENYLAQCAPLEIYTQEGYTNGIFSTKQQVDIFWTKNEILDNNYFFSLNSPKSIWSYDAGENEGPHYLLVGETIEGYWFLLSAGSGFFTGWEIGGSASVILAPTFEELYYLGLDEEERSRLTHLNVLIEKTLLENSIHESNKISTKVLKI